jgi:hypothetical protein
MLNPAVSSSPPAHGRSVRRLLLRVSGTLAGPLNPTDRSLHVATKGSLAPEGFAYAQPPLSRPGVGHRVARATLVGPATAGVLLRDYSGRTHGGALLARPRWQSRTRVLRDRDRRSTASWRRTCSGIARSTYDRTLHRPAVPAGSGPPLRERTACPSARSPRRPLWG